MNNQERRAIKKLESSIRKLGEHYFFQINGSLFKIVWFSWSVGWHLVWARSWARRSWFMFWFCYSRKSNLSRSSVSGRHVSSNKYRKQSECCYSEIKRIEDQRSPFIFELSWREKGEVIWLVNEDDSFKQTAFELYFVGRPRGDHI